MKHVKVQNIFRRDSGSAMPFITETVTDFHLLDNCNAASASLKLTDPIEFAQ